jgi:transcriptional regulator with PAS, ATPase and Fis domain
MQRTFTGETGTGKEVFANAIHEGSDRKKNTFVAINCSAFSKEILKVNFSVINRELLQEL